MNLVRNQLIRSHSFSPWALRVVVVATVGLLLPSTPTMAQDSQPLRLSRKNSATESRREHPLVPAIRLARECEQAVLRHNDYTATFTKREVVGRSRISQRMQIKIRHQPFSLYMRYVEPQNGREVIYVDGRNDGHVLAHETGLAGLVGILRVLPTSDRAMADSRHPVTSIGMANLAGAVAEQWEEESSYGEIDVNFYRDARLGTATCNVIESIHPEPRRQFRFHKTRLYIDVTTRLPVRVEQFGFASSPGLQPPLIEQYTYSEVRTDQGLSSIDFDTRNPQYEF